MERDDNDFAHHEYNEHDELLDQPVEPPFAFDDSHSHAPAAPLAPHHELDDPYNPTRLNYDLICVSCGYNLRGQLPSGQCPECGAPVHFSNRTDQLYRADPDWLSSLHYGMNWIVTGILVSLCFLVIGFVVGFFIMSGSMIPTPSSPPGTSPMSPAMPPLWLTLLSAIASVAQSVILGLGFWQLTRPEPARFNANPVSAMITRWTLTPAFAMGICANALAITQSGIAVEVAQVIQFIVMLLLLVGMPASLLYLRGLANRIPDPGLARQTSIVFWGNLISISVGISVFVLSWLIAFVASSSGSSAGAGLAVIGMLIICPMMIALLVFGIWWIVLMFLYRGQFAHVHNIAIEFSRNGEMHRPTLSAY